MRNIEKDFEEIYMTLTGNYCRSGGVPWVENAFAGGTVYNRAYQELWNIRTRLEERFGIELEDEDLEQGMNAVMDIEWEIAHRMFFYGIQYATQSKKCRTE